MTVVDTSVVVAAITASDSDVLSRCRAALDASSAPVAHVLIESFSVLTSSRRPGDSGRTRRTRFFRRRFPTRPLP